MMINKGNDASGNKDEMGGGHLVFQDITNFCFLT
jgi:hypothetical protein